MQDLNKLPKHLTKLDYIEIPVHKKRPGRHPKVIECALSKPEIEMWKAWSKQPESIRKETYELSHTSKKMVKKTKPSESHKSDKRWKELAESAQKRIGDRGIGLFQPGFIEKLEKKYGDTNLEILDDINIELSKKIVDKQKDNRPKKRITLLPIVNKDDMSDIVNNSPKKQVRKRITLLPIVNKDDMSDIVPRNLT